MRIDKLHLVNFKCFEDQTFEFHPNFNLIIGENASGKTTLLDSIKLSIKSFFFDITNIENDYTIKNEFLRTKGQRFGKEIRFEKLLPSKINFLVNLMSNDLQYEIRKNEEKEYKPTTEYEAFVTGLENGLTLDGGDLDREEDQTQTGKTIFQKSQHDDIKRIINDSIRFGKTPRVTLPLLAYYDIARHKIEREDYRYKWDGSRKMDGSVSLSLDQGGLAVYQSSLESGLPTQSFIDWFAKESWTEYEDDSENPTFTKVKQAILTCLEDATYIKFSPKNKEIIIGFNDDYLLFSNLSDGQKNILLLISDIARKMIQLNPHLGEKVLEETPGVVLIDELDLHLHPKWQRRIIGDLRRTFPKIQFFATTHSPQVISSAPADSLLMLSNERGKIEVSKRNNSYGLNSN